MPRNDWDNRNRNWEDERENRGFYRDDDQRMDRRRSDYDDDRRMNTRNDSDRFGYGGRDMRDDRGTTGRWAEDRDRRPDNQGGYAFDDDRQRAGDFEFGRDNYAGGAYGSAGQGRQQWGGGSPSENGGYGRMPGGMAGQLAEGMSGPHRGRGPKGYKRSDDRIREDLSDRLSDDASLDASNIEVSVSKGEVTLSGTVDSREAKRRAEDCAEACSGVDHVQNNLRVKSSNDDSGDGSKSRNANDAGRSSGTAGQSGSKG